MEELLNSVVSEEDLRRFEKKYGSELDLDGTVSNETKFEYAVVLVRSQYNNDIRKGIALLEDLARTHPEGKREYIYYLALGNARLKNHADSLKYCKAFQEIEPNTQVQELEEYVRKKYEKETVRGIAVAGGAAFVIGSIVSLGIALAKKKSRDK